MKKPLLAVGIAAAVSTSAVVPVASAAPAVVGGGRRAEACSEASQGFVLTGGV